MSTVAQDTHVLAGEFTGGDSLRGEMASFHHAKEQYNYFTPKIEDFCFRVLAGDAALIHALKTGDTFALDLAGPEHWMVKDIMASILLAGSDALVGLSWEQRGAVVGYLLPEITIAVAGTLGGEALGGPGGGGGVAVSKGTHSLYRFSKILKRLQSNSRLAGLLGDLRFIDKIVDQLEHMLLWSKIEHLDDSEKVFKILEYHRLTNASGLTAWEIFEKAAPKLKARELWTHDLLRGQLTSIADDFNVRLLANGGDYTILPTHKQVTDVIGRSGTPGFRSHHTQIQVLMKWIDDELGLPNVPRKGVEIDLDQTPAIPMWWEEHEVSKGGVRGSVHDVLEMQTAGGRITETFLDQKFQLAKSEGVAVLRESVGEFLDELENAYAGQLNKGGIGAGFRNWFLDRGL